MSNIIFFYGGPYSQWYRSKFTIDGVEYNCAEQYMMAMKAKTFGDDESLRIIMKSHEPWVMKAQGKKVKNFDTAKWNAVCREYVYKANYEKFSIPYLKKILLDTGDQEIVEASPTDCIWGIGLAEDDPLRLDRANWRGTNWLGEEIMRVRKDLRKNG